LGEKISRTAFACRLAAFVLADLKPELAHRSGLRLRLSYSQLDQENSGQVVNVNIHVNAELRVMRRALLCRRTTLGESQWDFED
jgi:hypothetical protein